MLKVEDHDFHYLDAGATDRPAVILAHCSNASHKQWLPLIGTLAAEWRILAPDLAGYGRSGRWTLDKPYHPSLDVNMLKALAAMSPAPVHLVGHSYGAAMLLEAARELGPRAASLTLIEPPSFHLLREPGHEAHWRRMTALTRTVLAAMAKGDRRRAAGAYMSFWIGWLRWRFAPGRLRKAVFETMERTAKEFESLLIEAPAPSDYAAITARTRLILGEKTAEPAKIVTRVIAAAIPGAETIVLKGAGHMSPFTHPDAVNRLIVEHIVRG
jgi:pimeloyl-ACP methyl ester carboxylesterase